METLGHVHNGVVVLDQGASLPEGTRVRVSVLQPGAGKPQIERVPGELPLVRGGVPGSVNLTNERIHELLDDEDVAKITNESNVSS